MRVIVCGSRGWTDRKAVEDALEDVLCDLNPRPFCNEPLVVVNGACRGPDVIAGQWSSKYPGTTSEERFDADWSLGKKAGPLRNQRMADAGAELCLAFWDGTSSGTLDMITRAVKAGIPVKIVPSERK